MKLWLLRHGEAEPHASRDSERRLTAHGRKEVLQSAARLAGLPLDGILASPYVRAQQTAELVREALGLVEPVGTAPWLTPDDDPREVLGFLDERSERNLLLVSHQPLVGALGGLLVHGNRRDPLPMSTASLAELEGDFAAAGLMTLVRCITRGTARKRLAQRLQTETFPGLPAVGCDGIFDQASAWSISQNNNNGGGTWSLQIVCRSKSSSSAKSVIRNGVTWCSPSVAAGSRS